MPWLCSIFMYSVERRLWWAALRRAWNENEIQQWIYENHLTISERREIHSNCPFLTYFSVSIHSPPPNSDTNRSKRATSYCDNGDAQPKTIAPQRATAVISPSSPPSKPTHGSMASPLNNSLNNILNYSPPQYANKTNVNKSTSSITSAIHRNPPTNGAHSYGSSLLCYQNVSPPSPTSSAGFNTNGSIVAAVETITKNDDLKADGTTTAGTLAGLTIGDVTTLPVAIKKRNKLRHRFSDVGSWGRKKKDRAHKYRSMNIESLEVLGDPVIEDEFFVSISSSNICGFKMGLSDESFDTNFINCKTPTLFHLIASNMDVYRVRCHLFVNRSVLCRIILKLLSHYNWTILFLSALRTSITFNFTSYYWSDSAFGALPSNGADDKWKTHSNKTDKIA